MSMGVDSKDDRKMALAAFKKAGYKSTVRDPVGQKANAVAGPSKVGSVSDMQLLGGQSLLMSRYPNRNLRRRRNGEETTI